MAKTTFTGPVISKKGFINTGPANVVDADSSISLTVDSHAGKIIHNDAAGAVTYTLPATNANADSGIAGPDADLTNLNNVGAKFTIVNSITKTGDLVVQVANATDVELEAEESNTVSRGVTSGKFKGFAHHYNCTRKKIDCANLDLKKIVEDIKNEQ